MDERRNERLSRYLDGDLPDAEAAEVLSQGRYVNAPVDVIEKSLAVGIGGIVSTDVRMALAGLGIPVHTVVAGLGGRAITRASLHEVFERAGKGALQRLTFLDMNHEVIDREIERLESTRMSGPTAENILRDLGTVADRIG